MKIKGQAQQLADYMIRLSRRLHGEDWCFALEFELWKEIVEEQDRLEDHEIQKLEDLAESCGGWIRMNLQTNQIEFLSTELWEKKYQEEKPF